MAEEFKVGDVVVLKSGGPRMTVAVIETEYGNQIVCKWFVAGVENSGTFPPDALTKSPSGGPAPRISTIATRRG